jgi:hypothetical protein
MNVDDVEVVVVVVVDDDDDLKGVELAAHPRSSHLMTNPMAIGKFTKQNWGYKTNQSLDMYCVYMYIYIYMCIKSSWSR